MSNTSKSTNIYIPDGIINGDKSSTAINYINNSPADERFIVITPYLNKVKRYKKECKKRHFKEPIPIEWTDRIDIKELMQNGENIISTREVFQRFDKEIIHLCKLLNYNLILDEVAEFVKKYPIKKDDLNLALEYCTIEEDTGKLIWLDKYRDYDGDWMYEVKNLCNLDSLMFIKDILYIWLFPVKALEPFNNVMLFSKC